MEFLLQNACICCFEEKQDLISLSKCNFTYILKCLLNLELNLKNSKICEMCHIMLRKIDNFKRFVEGNNIKLLNKKELKASKPRLYNCEMSDIEVSWTSLEQSLEYEIIKSQCKFEIKLEADDEQNLKIEPLEIYTIDTQPTKMLPVRNKKPDMQATDAQSTVILPVKNKKRRMQLTATDAQSTLPVENKKLHSPLKAKEMLPIKKKKLHHFQAANAQTTVTLPARTKTQRSQFQASYEGKLRIITLTMEELLHERQQEMQDEKYLRPPYKCADCIVAFEFEDSLIEHKDKKHTATEGSLVCSICKSVLGSQLSFHEHLKRHTRRYECIECGKRSKSVFPVLEHYNREHGTISVQYDCKLCNYSTDSNRRYRYHMDKHRNVQAQCKLCHRTFITNACLKVHMRSMHSEVADVYTCEVCGKQYSKRCSFKAHMQVHSPAVAYCGQCNRTFKTLNCLNRHARRHATDEVRRRFTCDECGKKFLTKPSLREHIDFDHLKNGKYRCDQCSKVLKTCSGLRRHVIYVHEKVRPPRNKMCDYCGRGFMSTACLVTHIRTHTGERPLQCPLCPATFAQSGALYTHKKLLHNPKRKQKC